MQLHYRKFGEEGDQPIIILHGIFGTSYNWFSYTGILLQEEYHKEFEIRKAGSLEN